jgi:TatD DNase family protein
VWFDSHCHLFECAPEDELSGVVARAHSAEVHEILVAGVDFTSSRRSVKLAAQEGIYAAVGVHPNACAGWEASWTVPVEELLQEEGVVALGESGLDFYRDEAPKEQQRAAFAAHIDLAKRFDRALVIHTRASVEAALQMLADPPGPPPRFVFHCWSGNAVALDRALGLGAYVSFAGNVSFKRSDNLRTLAALTPEDRILVETDSPYLAPEPYRGRPNEPANLVRVGAVVAAARGISPARLAAASTANARRLFGLAA